MTAPATVPPLDQQRRFSAQELLRARAAACAAGLGTEFDELTAGIVVARWRLAAATDPAEQNRHLLHVHELSQRRCALTPSDAAVAPSPSPRHAQHA